MNIAWIGVAVLYEDGVTDSWQMNGEDGLVQLHTVQSGVYDRGRRITAEELAKALVDTTITIRGRARRWGAGAQSGSPFHYPFKPPQIGS